MVRKSVSIVGKPAERRRDMQVPADVFQLCDRSVAGAWCTEGACADNVADTAVQSVGR